MNGIRGAKYYAVRIGKTAGIYRSWTDCQKQVKGYPGAIYKSFKTYKEAEEYIKPKKAIDDNLPCVEIYTDGSHQPSKNYLGLGAFCKFEGEEYEISRNCDQEYLSKFNIEAKNCSNPTAEFLGFAETLQYFVGMKGYLLHYYIDYNGVGSWMRNEWKCKEPYIKKIKNYCDEMVKKIECEIIITHINGHSGIYGNDRADDLAKLEENYSTFSSLRENLSK